MKNTKQGRLSIIFSMVIWGTLAPFVRKIAVTSGELALYRAVLAAAMIGIYLLVTKQKISVKSLGKELYFLLFSGIAMGFNWILLFEAYRYTTVSVATLSYYFAPVIVLAVCPFLFKERLTWKTVLCFVMATAGLVLITGTAGGGSQDLLGILFGLGAACFYAAVMLLNKFIKGVTHQGYGKAEPTSFTIAPYCLKVFKQRWYVLAASEYPDGRLLIYSLDRFTEMVRTEEKYEIPEDFDVEEYFRSSYGVSSLGNEAGPLRKSL